MYKDIEAVIFDVDGTLVDSMWIWKQVDIEFLGKRGIELPQDLQSDIEGLSYTETAGYFKERFGLTETVDDIKEEWGVMANDFYNTRVSLKKGAREFIEHISGKGLKLGIATSNSRDIVEKMLANHRLDSYFNAIRTSCEVARSKPFPDVYLKVAEDLGVSPEKCLVFEDTVAGVTAAKTAGMKVIAVADALAYESREKLEGLAQGYIHGFDEVMAYFL